VKRKGLSEWRCSFLALLQESSSAFFFSRWTQKRPKKRKSIIFAIFLVSLLSILPVKGVKNRPTPIAVGEMGWTDPKSRPAERRQDATGILSEQGKIIEYFSKETIFLLLDRILLLVIVCYFVQTITILFLRKNITLFSGPLFL